MWSRILWGLIIGLNLVRFWGFEISPQGFYIDEAVAATHVLCLKQTGADFAGHSYPLFSAGPGGGYFTAPYLYAQLFWTSIWGESTSGFRSFAALVTGLAVLFLTLYVRKKAGNRTAMWVALMATVSPWVFQFSRIAWDPPMVPMFLMLGLYLLEGKSRFSWVWSSIAFAGAAYAYPPARAQVPLLLILLPGIDWKKTTKMTMLFLVLAIPVLLKSFDPAFTSRTRMLALTSGHPLNPYRDESVLGLSIVLIKQILAHFDPQYLIVSGDKNLRHSTQHFGMMSWVQFAAFGWGLIWAVVDGFRFCLRRAPVFYSRLSSGESTLLVLGVIGTLVGIAPAAMTWEGVPHAIRSIGAWPFLCILSGVVIEISVRWIETHASQMLSRATQGLIWVGSLVFFGVYLHLFFGEYAEYSKPWYQIDEDPIAQAYGKMLNQGIRCEDLRKN